MHHIINPHDVRLSILLCDTRSNDGYFFALRILDYWHQSYSGNQTAHLPEPLGRTEVFIKYLNKKLKSQQQNISIMSSEIFELAYKVYKHDEDIRSKYIEKAANTLPLDQWMYSVQLGDEMYQEHLHSVDSLKNKSILQVYIGQKKYKSFVQRYQSNAQRYSNGTYHDIPTKENFYAHMVNDITITQTLLEKGYDFTPCSEHQRVILGNHLSIIVLLASYGQISAEYLCWLFGYQVYDMSDKNNQIKYQQIFRYCIKFHEFQPQHLKALSYFLSKNGYMDDAFYMLDYIELANATACHIFHTYTKNNLICDDNIFKHVILAYLI